MSRGGRGGFGGRGGGGFGSTPWTYDPDLKPDYTPSELFPPNEQPVQAPLTKSEKHVIVRFLKFRDDMHNGPFYTVLGKRKGVDNAFEEIKLYSQKYQTQKRKVPKLDARPFVFELFPEELHSTMDPTGKAGTGAAKKLTFNTLDALQAVEDVTEDEDDGTNEEGGDNKDEDDNQDLEEEQDDFEDDEENDYNAEQYFDDGEGYEDYGDDDNMGGDYY